MTTSIAARSTHLIFAFVAVWLATADFGFAQTYPSSPIKIIEPYPAGGAGDIIARLIGKKLEAVLKTSVVVINRPGASGTIGAAAVVNAAPDGYTLLFGHTGEIVINRHWGRVGGYDPDKDLMPVALAAVMPLALVVSGKAPYSTVSDMLKVSREKSKGLLFASSGTATPAFFAAEILKFKTKSNLTHVPYAGATPALQDLLGGHVDMYFSGYLPALPHVQTGALKLLAFSSGKRSALAPNIPIVAEAAGIDGFDVTFWMGFFLPRGTPATIAVLLNAEINKILAVPDVKESLAKQGADATPASIEAFRSFITAESDRYRDVIQGAGLNPLGEGKKN